MTVGLIDQPRACRCVQLHHHLGGLPREHNRQVGRVQPAHPTPQLNGVLLLLELRADSTLAGVLPAGKRQQRAVMVKHRRNLVERVLKVDRGFSIEQDLVWRPATAASKTSR